MVCVNTGFIDKDCHLEQISFTGVVTVLLGIMVVAAIGMGVFEFISGVERCGQSWCIEFNQSEDDQNVTYAPAMHAIGENSTHKLYGVCRGDMSVYDVNFTDPDTDRLQANDCSFDTVVKRDDFGAESVDPVL